jgi:GAF domain-containing protein
MRPIPQTIEAARQLSVGTDVDVLRGVQLMADRVQEVVPDCLGLSIAWIEQGVTFTLEATDEEIAVLDAVQYLDHGPCVQAVDEKHGLESSRSDLLDEGRWQMFASATAAHAVRSTLTFPLTRDAAVVGSVNLYAASDKAFEGHHEELAAILGASAAGAVRNADLTFATRALAQQAPRLAHDDSLLDVASGAASVVLGIAPALARQRMVDAARRAGISSERFAQALVNLYG